MFDIIIVDTGGYSFGEAERYAVYLSAYRRGRLGRKKSDTDKLLSLTAGLLPGLEISRSTMALPNASPFSSEKSTKSFTITELIPSVHSDIKNVVYVMP